jgi:flagellar basal-body rod modification protein FlgD
MTTSQPTAAASTGSSGIATDVNGNPLVNPSTQMDENSFLKLLTAQLKYQDPMSPTDSQAFVQEQAQFSMVEGILNVEKSLKALTSTMQLGQDIGMIGKQVTWSNTDGSTASGLVSGVATDSTGAITLTVGGSNVDPATLISISAATSTTGAKAGG